MLFRHPAYSLSISRCCSCLDGDTAKLCWCTASKLLTTVSCCDVDVFRQKKSVHVVSSSYPSSGYLDTVRVWSRSTAVVFGVRGRE